MEKCIIDTRKFQRAFDCYGISPAILMRFFQFIFPVSLESDKEPSEKQVTEGDLCFFTCYIPVVVDQSFGNGAGAIDHKRRLFSRSLHRLCLSR